MRRFPYPYVLLSLAVTLTLAGLFYLPYLSVRNKTINAFHQQQTLQLERAVEGIQGFFFTYRRALTYLADQSSIVSLDAGGRLLLNDFFAIHKTQLVAVLRSDQAGKVVFSVSDPERWGGRSLPDNPPAGALLKQTLTVSEPMAIGDEKCCVVMSHPLFKGPSYQGSIAVVISAKDAVQPFIDQVRLERAAYVMLFSRGGNILHAPQAELVGKSMSALGHHELLQAYEKIDGRTNGFFTLQHHAADTAGPAASPQRYGTHLPIQLPGDSSWVIVSVAPENEVLSTMAAFRKQWLIVTAITAMAVGCLSMGLTMVMARRRAEKEQREVQEQLVQLLDYAPMGVLLVNEEGVVTYANKAVSAIFDVATPRSVYEQPMLGFIHPDDRTKVAQRVYESRQTRSGETFMARAVATGGEYRDAKIAVSSFHLGNEKNCIVILQDITDERKVEETQRRLATAVEQVREMVMVTDTSWVIAYVNAAFCQMIGYSRQEAIGREYSLMCTGENEQHLFDHIQEVVSRGETWQGRIFAKRKNGTIFITASSVSPVRNMDGIVTHWVTVQRDITNEVEIESRLRQAQKMEAIGTFAGGIAHDFNNILGAIIGFTDMALLHSEKGSELYEHLVHIRQGGKRAADLVDQILTFSRQSTMKKIPVTVAPVIKESLRLIRASIPTTIAIDRRIHDQQSKVLAAPVQLQQIMMNLCSNAFYSMREHGGTLSITLERLAGDACGNIDTGEDGECLSLTVRDTGTGMEDVTLQRIFNPFFTTKEPGEGTGMGLSVVLGIVQDLGGDVQVDSVVDKGTTFTIYLPLAENDVKGEILSSEAPLPSGNEHVLVIDDEKEIRETFKMMLNHFGYRVTTTSNPKEVLSLLRDDSFDVDLLITDHTMPVMTGIELTREINGIRPELPVILCTGYSDRLNQKVAIEAGACDLMMKPVDLQELAGSVRSAIEGAAARRAES